jgi:hypothetical protein
MFAFAAVRGGGNEFLGVVLLFVTTAAVIVGAVLGLLASPALAYAISRGPWARGVLWVGVPTAVASFLCGSLGPTTIIVIILPMVYVGVAIMRGLHVHTVYARFAPGRCQKCNYDRTGLPPQAPCPECGAAPVAPTSAQP